MTMAYAIRRTGESRSFPEGDAFLDGAAEDADVVVLLGAPYEPDPSRTAILIELGTECLGVHTGEAAGEEGSNALGFARYRNGDDPPSDLVELVRQPNTEERAIWRPAPCSKGRGSRSSFPPTASGASSTGWSGRNTTRRCGCSTTGSRRRRTWILACRLGLGYPDGPVERTVRGGLAYHHDVSSALFAASGQPGDAPARAAGVARARSEGR